MRLDVPMLYQNDGIYRYTGGVSWHMLVTSVPIIIIYVLPHSRLAYFLGYVPEKTLWFVSFFIRSGTYTALTKVVSPVLTHRRCAGNLD
jgi:NCS1 family nucleobase:cation symporter-1